jgi:hypothetical protein
MAQTFLIQNGDWVVSSASGRPIVISGPEKTKQDIKEFFEIDIQPNGFGAGITSLVGMVAKTGSDMSGLIDRQITDGIAHFRSIQIADVNTPRTADERIFGVTNIRASQDRSDPTKYTFGANVVTESGKTIPVTFSNGDK